MTEVRFLPCTTCHSPADDGAGGKHYLSFLPTVPFVYKCHQCRKVMRLSHADFIRLPTRPHPLAKSESVDHQP